MGVFSVANLPLLLQMSRTNGAKMRRQTAENTLIFNYSGTAVFF